MQYTHLGRTGLLVSRLCLGTMNFGGLTGEAESHAIMDRALELGINFFDTANVYGWKPVIGRPYPQPLDRVIYRREGSTITEEIIGRWFAQGGNRREKTVIATKVYNVTGEWPNESKLSALHIRRACEDSLRRMRTDYIDLYQMHHLDRDTPLDEIWQAMEVLVQQGKILYVGSCNFGGWHVARACDSAHARHFMGLVSEQCRYNLTARKVELELLPACQDYGLGVTTWSPLAGGLLSGLGQPKDGRHAMEQAQRAIEANRPQLEAFERFCGELGHQPAHVAIAWLLHNPVISAPILGPRSVAQLEDAIRSLEVRIAPDALRALDTIFPGPGKAPEAYAW